jgi:hypothetical protein
MSIIPVWVVARIAFSIRIHPVTRPTPLVLRLRIDAAALGAGRFNPSSPLGRDFGSNAGTVAVHKQLSVAAVTGGDFMSLQRKLLQSRPVDIDAATPGQLLQCVQADTAVLLGKHLRYAVLGALFAMLKQGSAADFQ